MNRSVIPVLKCHSIHQNSKPLIKSMKLTNKKQTERNSQPTLTAIRRYIHLLVYSRTSTLIYSLVIMQCSKTMDKPLDKLFCPGRTNINSPPLAKAGNILFTSWYKVVLGCIIIGQPYNITGNVQSSDRIETKSELKIMFMVMSIIIYYRVLCVIMVYWRHDFNKAVRESDVVWVLWCRFQSSTISWTCSPSVSFALMSRCSFISCLSESLILKLFITLRWGHM